MSTTMDVVTYNRENTQRIKTVENSFGTSGKTLSKPGRFLMGHGRLMKQGRRRLQPKAFFLFNDVLVYGSIILGHWHKKQRIIPLENIKLEDMEDSEKMRNQFLIRTPSKSFFVSAPSLELKKAWIKHIEDCQESLLKGFNWRPSSNFAVTWIPDQVSERCMRCFARFTKTNRRHHCRKCGFLVCHSCSKQKVLIQHINPTKKQRVCKPCYTEMSKENEISRRRWDSTGKNSSEDEDETATAPDDEMERSGLPQIYTESKWLDTWMIS